MWKREIYFIEHYLKKSKIVESWYKNEIESKHYITITYFNKYLEEKYFYPSFIVYFKNWDIWIFDFKSWFTLDESLYKAKWLDNYIKEQNKKDKKYIWGIIEVKTITWSSEINFQINTKSDFNLNNKTDFTIFSDEYVLRKLLEEKLK